MFCGHVLSVEETLLQMEKRGTSPGPRSGSDKKETMPIVEIKDRRGGGATTDQVKQRPGAKEDEKREQ